MLTLPDIISYSSHGLIISNSSHIAQVSCRIIHAHDFETCSFIHSFDECNQNRFSINNSLIENSLTVIKRQVSRWNEAFLRSHNTGSYYCAFLFLSLSSLGQRVCVRKFVMTPARSKSVGKTYHYDRLAAALKIHITYYINEGNEVKTVSDMKLHCYRLEEGEP